MPWDILFTYEVPYFVKNHEGIMLAKLELLRREKMFKKIILMGFAGALLIGLHGYVKTKTAVNYTKIMNYMPRNFLVDDGWI